jgi:hypothetical protein
MTALQVLGLIAFIIALAGVLGYLFQSGDDIQDELPTIETFTPEELKNIKAAEAAYNKPVIAEELNVIEPEFIEKVVQTSKVFPPDATINAEAIVEKKVKEPKSEFPIDKPKKKRKYYPKKAK